MKCSNPPCNRGIGLASYRCGAFTKGRSCSKKCRDSWAKPAVPGRAPPPRTSSGCSCSRAPTWLSGYYNAAGLKQNVLANAPLANIRDTETELISALQLGQIDYLAIYRSDAAQHHLKFIDLPPSAATTHYR